MTKIKFREKVAGRKFFLMLMIFLFSTFCLTLPGLLSFVGVQLSPILTGGEYVSLIIGCFTIYAGSNVVQKRTSENKYDITHITGEE